MRQRADPKSFAKLLTDKELKLMGDFGLGYSNQEIAELRDMEVATVQGHRKSVMRKLNIRTSLGLMNYAIRTGFTRVSDIHRQHAAD